jgi:hypothetical protein
MKYTKRVKPKLKIVYSLGEIPDFDSEDEERAWWATHDLSDELYAKLPRELGPSGDMVYVLKSRSRAAQRHDL